MTDNEVIIRTISMREFRELLRRRDGQWCCRLESEDHEAGSACYGDSAVQAGMRAVTSPESATGVRMM